MKTRHVLVAMLILASTANSVNAISLQACKQIGATILGGAVGDLGTQLVVDDLLGLEKSWQSSSCKHLGYIFGVFLGWRLGNVDDSDDTRLRNKMIESYCKAFAIGSIVAEISNGKIFHFENPWSRAIWVIGCANLCGFINMDATRKAELEKLKAYYAMSDFDLKILTIIQDSTENAWSIDELGKYYQDCESPLRAMCEHMSVLRVKLTRAYKNISACTDDVITVNGTFYKTEDLLATLDSRLEGLEKALFLIDQKANRYLSMQVNQEYIL